MKRASFGLVLAFLTVTVPALADGSTWGDRYGPTVSWDRIEGTIILPNESAMQVGPFFPASLRFRIGGEGKVVLYLDSGFLFFQVKGLSWADHYSNGPLGSGLTGGEFVGTLVCDSIPLETATYQSVDSPKVVLNQGAASFAGMVTLPQVCRDAPEKIVFLLRHDPDMANPNLRGKFVAYGAGRVIR